MTLNHHSLLNSKNKNERVRVDLSARQIDTDDITLSVATRLAAHVRNAERSQRGAFVCARICGCWTVVFNNNFITVYLSVYLTLP